MYIQGTFMKIRKLSIENLVEGIQAILAKVCTVCAHYWQFSHLIIPNRQGNYSNPMQIAFNILTEGIEQMDKTNTAEQQS